MGCVRRAFALLGLGVEKEEVRFLGPIGFVVWSVEQDISIKGGDGMRKRRKEEVRG